MTRTALLVSHPARPEALAAAREAEDALVAAGFTVRVADGASQTDLSDVEVAVVLGGDGTILRAAYLTRGTGVPILGVNLGHVGFLAESEREDITAAAERLAARDYEVEERGTLDVTVLHAGTTQPVGAQQVTVERQAGGCSGRVEVDGRLSARLRRRRHVDSTGSTAHVLRGRIVARGRRDARPALRARAVRSPARGRTTQPARDQILARPRPQARSAPTARAASSFPSGHASRCAARPCPSGSPG